MAIDRALIIRRPTHDLSKRYAAMCAESCDQHGLPWEYIDGVENLSCVEAFAEVGTKPVNGYTNTPGDCCCHASHILAWKRIVEIGKPCLILEHDAIVLGDVRTVDLPDMAVVTFGHRVRSRDQYRPPSQAETIVRIPRSVGVHACGLTPKTAQWLYEDAMQNGIGVGVDRWLMMKTMSGLPLYVCEPPQVVCWVRASTSHYARTKQYENGGIPKVVNYPESFTPGWKKGLQYD